MTVRKQVYKCNVCGNIVEVLHEGAGHLVCCGQEMELQEEKSEDTGFEKHLPVLEKTAEGVKVKIGSIPHPMVEEHYIEWIELGSDDAGCREFLKPGDEPDADFSGDGSAANARAYCNVHGLWAK